MNDFLLELSELLKKYDAEIWASTDTQSWNRIGVECKECGKKLLASEVNKMQELLESYQEWIDNAKDMILSNNLHQTDFHPEGEQFLRLIDEAPV